MHLNESVKELMMDGYSESDAFRMAVERFGGLEQAEKLISLMQIRQKLFANWLLKIGISSLFIVSLLFMFLLYLGNVHDAHFADIGYDVGEKFSSMNSKTMHSLFASEPFVLKASLYNTDSRQSNFTFENKKLKMPALFKSELHYETDQSFVSIEVVDVRTIGFFLFTIGATVFYILFTVWGFIQLYHAGQLKFVWIISLIVLNVLGYGLFLLLGKRDKLVK
ncbi:hypothetical protein, partial [Bacillus smithii]|uniref:hypothetical protein n=1 Tax=Bacillus smithii TaxID=1479 RepID=UPI0030C9130E